MKQLTLDYVKQFIKDEYVLQSDYSEYFKNLSYAEENRNKELIQAVSDTIQTRSLEPLYIFYDNLFSDDNDNSYIFLKEAKDILIQDVSTDINSLEMFEVREFIENNSEEIDEIIYEREVVNQNNSFVNMLKYIDHLNCYINLGKSIDSFWQYSDETEEVQTIVKFLMETFNIENDEDGDNKYLIHQMLLQGSDGEVSVWFTFDMNDFIIINEEDNSVTLKDISCIEFKHKVTLGVVDFVNGGGDSQDFVMSKPTYIKYENIIITFDYITGYNYVHDVCGMSRNWLETVNSVIDITDEQPKEIITINVDNSNIESIKEQELKYENNFNQGNCTLGDTNMNRHKNREYFNEPPYCRWQCSECGQTWLD